MLIRELEGSARGLLLQPKAEFVHKCIQLWETIRVRHGLMMVGQTVSGKTEIENVLAGALAAAADGANYLPVHIHKMNPKSIRQGELYGDFDESTHEWSDGILALTVRFAACADLSKWQWVLLDGPVDAVWIANMNTVLDDNKKLCLNSGVIIELSSVTRMMFEGGDLAVASPATFSRCGMVFVEQLDIGRRVLLDSWCERLPERLHEFRESIREHFHPVDASWEMVLRRVKQPVPVNCDWLACSLLKLYLALQCKELYQYLSGVLALIGTLVIGAYMALAGYYLKNCCEERKDELETDWMRDPQEQEVHDSLARYEAENELSVRRTGWAAMPVWMRGLLITAALLSSACTHLLLVPFGSPFQQFKLTDHIYELPGGNVLGIVKARGAVGCVCFLSALTIAVVLQIWYAVRTTGQRGLVCPLPAYLSKAAGLRMLSEPLFLAVDSELDTELDRRPQELRRH